MKKKVIAVLLVLLTVEFLILLDLKLIKDAKHEGIVSWIFRDLENCLSIDNYGRKLYYYDLNRSYIACVA